MGQNAKTILLTYEDYAHLPNDGRRYELYEGRLVVTPAPTPKHQLVLGNLYQVLRRHIDAGRLGQLLFAPIDLILNPSTVLQPDLIYLRSDRLGLVTDRGVEGPPDLIVEVLSPATERYDRQAKMQIYATAWVVNYWLVDPDRRNLEAYELVEEGYQQVASLQGQAVFESSLFFGLAISLEDLWL